MEVLSIVAAAESEVQSENSAASRKLSALDWERRTEPGIQRDFKTLLEDPEAGWKDAIAWGSLTATPWCNCSSNARTLALRKRIRSSLSWKVRDSVLTTA